MQQRWYYPNLGGEKINKITVLTKEQKEIIEKLDLEDKLLFGA
jgi:hypothetical protein